MKVLLISTNRNPLPMPVMPVGACLVAQAAERAGHDVQLLDLMFVRETKAAIRDALVRNPPDLIALSVRNIDNNAMTDPHFFLHELRELMGEIRSMSCAPLVLGGAALGVMPEQILRFCPALCCVTGSGETVFPLLLENISRNGPLEDVPGIAWLHQEIFQKNRPPAGAPGCHVPDYNRWLDVPAYTSQLATFPLQTKTGCQFNCVYCTYPVIEGNDCLLKDPDRVADAVFRLAAAGFRDIEFVDSIFNSPRDHAMQVCEALARVRHGARLQCLELNPLHFDHELVQAMERAGFRGMGITLESAADPVLQGLRKGFASSDVHRAAAVVRDCSIPCAWIFMLGGPGETRHTVRESIDFARSQIRPRDVAFFNIGIRIYPGTELESIARREGLLKLDRQEMLEPVFYLSPEVDMPWLKQELSRALAENMNFISMDSLGLPFLPTIYRTGKALGMRPPLWRYTRLVRRCLRLAGMDV